MGDIRLMKYKVGDKVKIKTWKEMVEEFGPNEWKDIHRPLLFLPRTERELDNLETNRILTIKDVKDNVPACGYECYIMKEIDYICTDEMIKCLVEEYKKEIEKPITSRWEILDIR